MSTKYLALLRGINVGGKNIIKMADLRQCFESMDFTGVSTYIQSGNVIFSSPDSELIQLTGRIEDRLSEEFDYASKVLLVPQNQLEKVIKQAPKGYGDNHEEYRYDVLFLMPGIDVDAAASEIETRDGIDEMWPGDRVIYFSRLIEKAGSSYLNKLVSSPVYKKMTIRNWRTTSRLNSMMQNPNN